MAKLFGAQRMVLHALLEAQGGSQAFIEDSRIAQTTRISLRDMRDWFLTLDNDEYVDLALTESGMSASVTPKGRLALGLEGKHGLFTEELLTGLRGAAANKGEVTINSLYDYIDKSMGSSRQRPMMFGTMTGRVVLMHVA
jgi:hypothetical protein